MHIAARAVAKPIGAPEPVASDKLRVYTETVIAAYLSRNDLSADQLNQLTETVYAAFVALARDRVHTTHLSPPGDLPC